MAEAAQVHQTVRQYLREVEEQNPLEEPVHEQDQVSTTDPDSTYCDQGRHARSVSVTYDNYLVDNHSCVIVGVQGTAARMSQETVAAQNMLTRFTPHGKDERPTRWRRIRRTGTESFCNGGGSRHHSLYANPRQHPPKETVRSTVPSVLLINRKATAIAVRPESNSTTVAAASGTAPMSTLEPANVAVRARKDPNAPARPSAVLAIHMEEPSPATRPRVGEDHQSLAHAQRQRKKVEALFAELKNQIGLRRLRLRRIKFVREQFFLASGGPEHQADSCGFSSQPTNPVVPVTA